eukprot:TRINITY_DN5752_c0_g1_i2.p1 TRINITY_DN5752_c0_g1~~TRINITY_DN5752_c0_g1_i2.p1  ORF type:complete len:157 (+),score=41.16 TRINITY_DN5752_c0_g1_i2:17-487(+)
METKTEVELKYSYERLIFILDLDAEINGQEFSKKKEKMSRLDMVKDAIKAITRLKMHLSSKHQFALMILTTTAEWIQDFTNDYDLFTEKMSKQQPQDSFPTLNFYTIFEALFAHIPQLLTPTTAESTPYTYRVILFYSRSNVIPDFPKEVPLLPFF